MQISGDGIFICEFNSDFKETRVLNSTLEEIFEFYSLDDDLKFRIEVCITEAVNNALLHGNEMLKSKTVIISCFEFQNHLRFTIKDEGLGFNFENSFTNCLEEPFLSQPSGRGIFLISNYADQLEFLDRGRVVQLDFSLGINE